MQPYFLPYLGYFQLMAQVDAFVVFDDVHFINRGWINRNRININGVPHWITVPLQHASQNRLICDIELAPDDAWRGRLLKSIQQAYARAPQFSRIYPLVTSIVECRESNLADYLYHSLSALHAHLGLKSELVRTSRTYGNAQFRAQARIIDICRREGAATYINPPGGTELYDPANFAAHGIELAFLNPALPPYATGRMPCLPGLSIVDVLMHVPPESMAERLYAGTLS